MAVVKTVLKNSESETVVKVAGSGAGILIDLQVDLLSATQVLDGATQTVNITGISWTGETTHYTLIDRNEVRVATLSASAAGSLMFDGQTMPPENTENTSGIFVAMSGTGEGECWIRLRKVSGYKSKVETSIYGSYDDPTRVGASTTMPGSPDYIEP